MTYGRGLPKCSSSRRRGAASEGTAGGERLRPADREGACCSTSGRVCFADIDSIRVFVFCVADESHGGIDVIDSVLDPSLGFSVKVVDVVGLQTTSVKSELTTRRYLPPLEGSLP